MRKVFLTLIFILSSLYSENAPSDINEYKVDLYYANGIMMMESESQAKSNWKDEVAILIFIDHPELQKHIGKIDVAYNLSNGFAADIWEAFLQKAEHELGATGWFAFTTLIGEVGKIGQAIDWLITAGEQANNMLQHDGTLKGHIEKYEESIKAGHGVVVVAHSQGNLFVDEAFKGLKNWMKPYFHTIAVASPTTSIPNDGEGFTFDNDIIDYIGEAGTKLTNPNRYDYEDVTYDDLGNEIGRVLMRNGDRSLEFHSFSYYMGYPVEESIAIPDIIVENIPGQTSIQKVQMQTDKARNLIHVALYNEIRDHLDNRESQWYVGKQLGCPGRCDFRLGMKHVSSMGAFAGFNPPFSFNAPVIPFIPREKTLEGSNFGKLYKVDGKYVKTDRHYADIREEVNKDGVCQVIRTSEDRQNTLFEFKGNPYPKAPGITSGVVGVLLSWDMCYPDIDLDLDIGGLADWGEMDVKNDKNASFEHFFIKSESDIIPSNTPHEIYAHDKTDHSKLDPNRIAKYDPIDIAVAAYAPGTAKVFKTQIRDLGQLDLGHILDILVTKKHVTYPTRTIGGGSGSGGGGGTPSVNPCEGQFDCGCIPCEYTITNFLKNAMLGPISGGAVTIHKMSTNAVVYTGITSQGDDIVTTGVIDIPSEILETFADEEIYLIDVEGGEDIDSDDDFYIDGTPTPNHGTLHAIVTGKQLKYLSFKVNILTEIAYQVSKDKLKGSKAQLLAHLDDIAKKIFRQKVLLVDETQALNYLDILTWVPTLDKQSLKKDYDTHVDPIVQKVYANEDRLQESYDFVYKRANANAPEIGTLNVRISEGLPVGAVVGSLEILTHGDSNIKLMNLAGVGAENFSISKEGVVSVAKDMNASVKFYSLTATATNENNYTSISVSVLISVVENKGITVPGGSVPYVASIVKRDIDENSPEGLVVGKVTFEDVNNSISSVQIEGGSTQFDVALDGTVTVAANADIDYEKTQNIGLKISATNSIGNSSLPVTVNITVNDVIDTPVYKIFFVTHIDENLSSGSVIGQLEQVRAGASEISSIDILNSNVPFVVDTNGTIRLDGYVDYETKNEYNLVAIARSATGDSNRIYMNIYVDDVLEVGMPELYDFNTTIDENIPSDKIIGTLNFLAGQSAITSMTLSGVGSTNFTIDTNGVLSTASNANIDYESLNAYDLEVIARNANGSSNVAHVRIDVNDVLDVSYELLSFTASVDENASVGTIVGKLNIASQGDGNITDYTLTGTGNKNFSIDENGTIRVSSSANLDYETTPSYTLQATVLSDAGESVPSTVRIYILNIPENPPVLKPLTLSIEENASIGTEVGTVEEDIGGDSPIVSYMLDDNSTFSIDANGTLRVAGTLDYETQKVYVVGVTAQNAVGNSQEVNVTVNIVNVPEFVPELEPFIGYVEENASSGTLIGDITFSSYGDTTVNGYRLDGIGKENFTIDTNGTLRVSDIADFNETAHKSYSLQLQARNEKGYSDIVDARIVVTYDKVKPLAPREFKIIDTWHNTMTLSWKDISDNERGFNLYKDGVHIATLDANTTTYTVTNLTENTTYLFELRAFNDRGESDTAELYSTTDIERAVLLKNLLETKCGVDVSAFDKNFNVDTGEYNGSIDCSSRGLVDEDLEGLRGLRSISGSLSLYENKLTTLTGLANLKHIGDRLDVDDNNLENLVGLDHLVSIGDDFYLEFNPLTTLQGLENLVSIGGDFYIGEEQGIENIKLLNVDSLHSLTTVRGELYLASSLLENINGLSSLETVGNNLTIRSPHLTNLDGLRNLISVRGISIGFNENLTDISGISNVKGRYKQSIYIDPGQYTVKADGNSSFCSTPWSIRSDEQDSSYDMSEVCSEVSAYEPSGLDTLVDVLVDSCGMDALYFYRDFNETTGYYKGGIYCANRGLTDTELEAFSKFTGIERYLYLNNNDLTTLDGLRNLKSLGGAFYINNNENLIDISSISNILGKYKQDIHIDIDQYKVKAESNSSFCSKPWNLYNKYTNIIDDMTQVCDGFEPYTTQSDSEKLLDVLVDKCGISSESFYQSFDETTGYYNNGIYCSSKGLVDAELDNFTIITGIGWRLDLSQNKLTHVDGLVNLLSVSGDLKLNGNDLINVNGLLSLDSVGRNNNWSSSSLLLNDNNLTTLRGLENLTRVTNQLNIMNNPNLVDISAISKVIGKYKQGLYIDTNQYTTKAETNSSFCSKPWDINDPSGNIVDDMTQVCDSVEFYVLNDVEKLLDVLVDKCGILSQSFYQNFDEMRGYYDSSINCSEAGLTNVDLVSFNQLKEIRGNLDLDANYLTNVDGLSNLQSVGGRLNVSYNNLTNILGLEKVSIIGNKYWSKSGLYLNDNNLTSLNGLQNIVTLGGSININNNTMLLDISSLANIEGTYKQPFILDQDQYSTKVDSNSSFCSSIWDLQVNGKNIDDNMSQVCTEGSPYIRTDVDKFKDVLIDRCQITLSNILNNYNEATGYYDDDIECSYTGLTNTELLEFKVLRNLQGNLELSQNNLTNLNGLTHLQSVSGSLTLDGNPLENIAGLNSLSKVGRDFIFTDEDGNNTNNLLNVDGLEALKYVGGSFILDLTPLENIDALSSLTSTGSLSIRDTNITTLNGLRKLIEVRNELSFDNNPNLTDISGISNVVATKGKVLSIDSDQYLVKADENTSFCSVVWDLRSNNINIPDDMSLVCTLSAPYTPTNEDKLRDMLGAKCYGNSASFYQNFNPQTGYYNGSIYCNSKGLVDTDLEGFIVLKTVSGSLSLYGNKLTNVDTLSNLSVVGSYLHLGRNQLMNISGLENLTSLGGLYLYSNKLTDVDGLSNLTSVEGTLYLSGNHLYSIYGLRNLTIVGEHLYLNSCSLSNVDALKNLTEVRGELHLEYNNLTNLDGLVGLARLDNYLNISGNYQLKDIRGLQNISETYLRWLTIDVGQYSNKVAAESSFCSEVWDLRSAAGDIDDNMTLICSKPLSQEVKNLQDTIANNCNTASTEFLFNFDESTGVYSKGLDCSNQNLTDTELLNFLIMKEVQGDLYLNNNQLINVNGLANLTNIYGGVYLNGNEITTLSGLSNLVGIGGNLDVSNNQLTSLDGLPILNFGTRFDSKKNILIHGNTNLDDISALGNISGKIGQKISIDARDYLVKVDNSAAFCSTLWDIYEGGIIKNSTVGDVADDMSKLCDGYTYVETDETRLRTLLAKRCTIDYDSYYNDYDDGGRGILDCTAIWDTRIDGQTCKIDSAFFSYAYSNGVFNSSISCQNVQDTEMSGFTGLLEVNGNFAIEDSNITTVDELIRLKSVTGSISIQNNTNLTDIHGLSNTLGVDGQRLILDDATQYTIKADETLDFCLTGWNIYTGTVNSADDMTAVCAP